MRTLRPLLLGSLIFLTAFPTQVIAQRAAPAQVQHAVDPSAIAGAIANKLAKQDADRSTLRQVLASPDVRETAARVGIDLKPLTAAVETLNGADLEKAAVAARQVNDALVGGASTVVLSTTTIILGLLILLLIVIAID